METTAQGTFYMAAQVSTGGESQYLSDGSRTFEVPPGANTLNLTVRWSSPIEAQYQLRLGRSGGGFFGEPVAGGSPLVLYLTGGVPEGSLTIIIGPAGGPSASPYQEFAWEAVIMSA